jgi:SAM-dependent methyltransferase
MNQEHLTLCSSAEWAEAVQRWIIPWVLETVDLGDEVLEVGPGPGLTTDVLRARVARLTAVEIHPDLAATLGARLANTNVDVVCADATRTPLPAGRFSGAVCLTMLHHVSSCRQQDAVLAEIYRLLRPGGVLAGQDSLDNPSLRSLHHDDIYVPVDPSGLQARLETAGFAAVHVDTNEYAVRFWGTKAREATDPGPESASGPPAHQGSTCGKPSPATLPGSNSPAEFPVLA